MANRRGARVPQWRLNSRHGLVRYSERGTIQTLSGKIIAVNYQSLSFEISSRDKGGNDHLRVLALGGTWQADSRNRLVFLIHDNREEGCLVFRNSWQLNRDREIVYTFEDSATGRCHQFCLTGHWKLDSAERITYMLGNGRRSIAFRCQLESLSLYPAKGKIKFRVGVGGNGGSANDIFIFGSWNISRNIGITIQAGPYGAIEVAARVAVGAKDTLLFSLLNSRNKPCGVTVELARRLVKGTDAEAFLRLTARGAEKRIETGVAIPF